MTIEEKNLLKIIKAAVNNENMSEISDEISWNILIDIAVNHKVDGLVCYWMEKFGYNISDDILNYLNNRYKMYIARDAIQDFALEELLTAFENEGIRNVPLKGSVLKYFYPSPELRTSGDIDILIEEKDQYIVNKIMSELGYNTNHAFDAYDVHSVYSKAPDIHIEIHRMLVSHGNRAYDFCAEVWNYVTLREGYKYTYNLSKEYLYVYIVAHLCKHLKNGGAGIRLILDIWVLLRKWEEDFDKKKLSKLVSLANMNDIECWSSDLARYWFSDKESITELEKKLEEYVLKSGVFGTAETQKQMRAHWHVNTKAKSLIKAIFLSKAYMQQKYPILLRHSYLLPLFWVLRCIQSLFMNRKTVKLTFTSVFSNKELKDDQFCKISEAVRDI